MVLPRDWRTRPDPFEEDWSKVEGRLRDTPELSSSQDVVRLLQNEHPDRYDEGQLRTLQRQVRQWRAAHAPEHEIVLAQKHRAGKAAQTGFTHATELGATIAGQLFVHMAVRAPAAVLELAVGANLRVGVDGGAAARDAARGAPTRARAALPPKGLLEGIAPSNSRRSGGVL